MEGHRAGAPPATTTGSAAGLRRLRTVENPGCGGRRGRGQTRTGLGRPGRPSLTTCLLCPLCELQRPARPPSACSRYPRGHTGSGRAAENRPAVHSAARCPAEPLSTPNALSPSFISCPWDRGGHMAPYDIGFRPGAVLPSHGDRWHRQSPASGRLSDASLFLKTFSCESSSTPGRSRGPRPTRRPRGLPLEPRLLLRGVTPTALPRGSSR